MFLKFCKPGLSKKFLISTVTNSNKEINLRKESTFEESTVAFKRKYVELEKAYVPNKFEGSLYKWWESQNYFKPNTSSGKQFTILLPPPNVTGTLHLGHALTATLQDVLIRWRRMRGESVLWLPGLDHAGIATQVVVEKKILSATRKTRHELGKEKFLDEIWDWKHIQSEKIIQQLKELGCSLNWNKTIFTMDDDHSEAVTAAFIRLFEDDLIYRADSLINWSCFLKSSISDIEVEWKEINGPTMISVPGYEKPVQFGTLVDFAYKVVDEDNEIVVSTTRPETMLGDVAIAVHPNDDRYTELQNKYVWHPFRRCKIPIICDEMVDTTFGTGAVKITPAHSSTDFAIAARHNLDSITVFNESGLSNPIGCVKKFHGVQRFDLKKYFIDELTALGLLRSVRDHEMKLPICSRSGDVIEHLTKPQWFVRCRVLADRAIEDVKKKKLRMEPENYEKEWFEWLKNIKDWNISRQLWWGHQIPVYDCTAKHDRTWVAAHNVDEALLKASSILKVPVQEITAKQDSDVLDTWFSSAILPLTAVGWPNANVDLEPRYPLSLMETGHDILFFWVARMVMLSTYLTGELPFRHVLLHGVFCDSMGRKMSKSLGNVIHPENVVRGSVLRELHDQAHESHQNGLMSKDELNRSLLEQKKMFPQGIPACGADALRFTLCSRNVANKYMSFDLTDCNNNRLFCNKIFQAVKFLHMSRSRIDEPPSVDLEEYQLKSFEKWILSRMSYTVKQVESSLTEHQFHKATFAIRTFLYNELCDVYVETMKLTLQTGEKSEHFACIAVLFNCIETFLRLTGPFMPFLCEHLYQSLPMMRGFRPFESIGIAHFPSLSEWIMWHDCEVDKRINRVLEVVYAFRRLKSLYGLHKAQKPSGFITCLNKNEKDFDGVSETVSLLSQVGGLEVVSTKMKGEHILEETANEHCIVYLVHDMDRKTLLDNVATKLNKEPMLQKNLERLAELMADENYEEKTSAEVKKKNRMQVKTLQTELGKIKELRKKLQPPEP